MASKNMKARGWHGESKRHSVTKYGAFASKGILDKPVVVPRSELCPDGTRATSYKGKTKLCVPYGQNIYLGRKVKDRPPEGFSDLDEVRDTLDAIENDYKNVIIDRKKFNARLMRLVGIIRQVKHKGELSKPSIKRKAIALINKMRKKWHMKPVENRTTKQYPTPAQRRAAKRNIKYAHRKIAEKYEKELKNPPARRKSVRRKKRA